MTIRIFTATVLAALALPLGAATVAVDGSAGARQQPIDGFGTCIDGNDGATTSFQQLFYDDMGCSILRIDLSPSYVSPYSDWQYNSPTYGQPGPNGNYCHAYTNASTYSAAGNGHSAPIAVMGPDIAANIAKLSWSDPRVLGFGAMAQAGKSRAGALGGFKLYASVWSPPPWLKLSSGHTIGSTFANGPAAGTPWPFIWLGNYSGGKLDTSGTALAIFNDGVGPTSALTQWARTLAAEVKGYQDRFGISFYAISLQNELNFEEFYSSCTYQTSAEYIAMLKAVRAEFDKYPDLAPVRIAGPEDVIAGDAWSLWQYGSGTTVTHKNLQYLQKIAADPVAAAAVGMYCIHGYANDGVTAAGADPQEWSWWANGWTTAPALGLPTTVKGFSAYGKKSWMSETSGEATPWLSPATGFPNQGAFSIALKIHQALTAGRESAWLYWQMGNDATTSGSTLTDATTRQNGPKYVAAKHFFRFIRPGSVRTQATSSAGDLLASAYVNDATRALTVVLVNTNAAAQSTTVSLASTPAIASFTAYTSSSSGLWKPSSIAVSSGKATVTVPGYGVVTLTGTGSAPPANVPPTVSLTSPAGGASFTAPATITVAANAGDSDGTIAKVEFYAGSTLIGTDTASPYSLSWSNVAAGSYSLTAKAYDNSGAVTTSAAVAITVAAAPPPAGSGTGLIGQYWSNQLATFTGSPTLVRTDATVDFDWGAGAPAAGITADHFTARWTGQVQAPTSETYTFFVTGDDGVRLWVNGQPLIDRWINEAPTEWSGALALIAGQKYDLKLEYYENGGGAVAKLAWSSASTAKAIIPQSRLYPAGGGGLSATYWDNSDFTGASVSRVDPVVDFDWGAGSPDAAIGPDTFSARWTGYVRPPTTGPWTFTTTTDDGVRLWVNGQLLIDDWTLHGPTARSASIALTGGGLYAIRMDYFENGGGAVARLHWSSSTQADAAVPASALYPAAAMASAVEFGAAVPIESSGSARCGLGAGIAALAGLLLMRRRRQ